MSKYTKELELTDFEAGMLPEEAIEAKKRYDAFPKLLEACKRALAYCWKSTNDNPEKFIEQAIVKAEEKE